MNIYSGDDQSNVLPRARAGRGARKRKAHKPVSHGTWKLVYADFVTVMMAFFIVVWIMLFDLVSEREKLDVSCLKPLASALNEQIEASTKRGEKNAIQVEYSIEGLRLTLLDINGPMFQSGSARLSDFAKQQFGKIALVTNICPTHKLKIEGYTDAQPFAGGIAGYSNWELSTERANAARRELVAQNVGAERIAQVIGYGDSLPSVPSDPKNALNRRISITVLPPRIVINSVNDMSN